MTTMREALEAALPYLDNSDSPGGCDGRHKDCAHCRAIAMVRAALSAEWRPDPKTVEECAKVAEALFKINGKHVSPAGKAVAEAIRSLSNQTSAEKND